MHWPQYISLEDILRKVGDGREEGGDNHAELTAELMPSKKAMFPVLFDQLYVFNTWFVRQLAPTNYLMLPGIFVLHALLGPVHPRTIKPFLCHPFYPNVTHM